MTEPRPIADLPADADDDAPLDTVDIMGVRVTVADRPLLRRRIIDAVKQRRQLTITFTNPNYVMCAQRNERLRDMMNGFDMNLADGWGVVLASHILGKPVPERMANDDLTDDLFGLPAEYGWRVFLFGNEPGVADQAATNLRGWYPGVSIVGTEHGHWADATGRIPDRVASAIVEKINEAGPDILHVGLGTPLQQTFVTENRHRLDVPVILTCGAYLEHFTERRHYYPPILLRIRCGWLYRLYSDPKKMWRRYTLELGGYLLKLVRHRLRHGAQS
jgi:N-acetylglucosaminyldiphosphoundecaprenol N-acetyl-beta-D-mannosaminyltransferase